MMYYAHIFSSELYEANMFLADLSWTVPRMLRILFLVVDVRLTPHWRYTLKRSILLIRHHRWADVAVRPQCITVQDIVTS